MFSLKITRWLIGYVRFSVMGGSPESFFNSCARAGVYLWNISSRQSSGACVSLGRYRRLRPYARKAGCRLRVRERHGFPFLFRRAWKHSGLFAGAAVSVVILILLSMHVWCVELVGNSDLDTGTLLNALSAEGLYSGAKKSAVDTGRIEQKMMLLFPRIGWISINTQGCMMQVCLQEKTDRPDIVEQNRPCNLKASATGQIVSLRIFSGTALVKKGDAVVAGQLLVSGVVEDQFGGVMLKHASAEIMADTTRAFETQIPTDQNIRETTGSLVTRRSLQIFGAHLPLTFVGKPKGDYEMSGTRTDLRLFGTLLPVSLFEEDWTGMKTVPVTLTRAQALRQAQEQLDEYEKNLPQRTRVLSVRWKDRTESRKLFYTAVLQCEENIAKESEILIKS